jgi:hypothetical protein
VSTIILIIVGLAIAIVAAQFIDIWADRPPVMRDPQTNHWTAARSHRRHRHPRVHGDPSCHQPCCNR